MRVPKILHFCFGFSSTFGHKPWSLIHHVSVASAIDRIRPDAAFIYFEYQPQGPWWDLSRRLLTPVHMVAPREVFGNPVIHPAHRADVVRLQKLLKHGGIYLDTDVLVHRSFDPMCDYPTVLGQQGKDGSLGMANAIILAEPESDFIRLWLDSYRTFRSRGRDQYWDEHSVKIPAILAARHPEAIRPMSHRAFYWPLWYNDHLKMIFGPSAEVIVNDDTFATHLWETHAWRYLEHLTPRHVRETDSNFHRWARPYVSELPDDFGAPRMRERAAAISRKPRLVLTNAFEKLSRGSRIMLRGRETPRV
jgi:hypothetical protein